MRKDVNEYRRSTLLFHPDFPARAVAVTTWGLDSSCKGTGEKRTADYGVLRIDGKLSLAFTGSKSVLNTHAGLEGHFNTLWILDSSVASAFLLH